MSHQSRQRRSMTEHASAKLGPSPTPRGISVQISNRQRHLPVDRSRIRSVARHVLKNEGRKIATLEVALVDDETIRKVHREFLGLDEPTDVLTFPLHEPNEPVYAEVVISAETAVREAPKHCSCPSDELLLYMVHGILHLCGYDDHTAEAARLMRARQRKLLQEMGC